MTTRKRFIAVAFVAFLAGSTQLLADPPQNFGYGPGMMGGYGMGPGMMYGYGPGYGMGPGMMGGYGGYGMGHGMMYGYGPGYGTALNLSDDQRSKITKIQQGLRSKQWELMGKIQDEYAAQAEASDDAAASKAEDRVAELQQQMLSNATTARKQMDAVLTPAQRQQLRRGG